MSTSSPPWAKRSYFRIRVRVFGALVLVASASTLSVTADAATPRPTGSLPAELGSTAPHDVNRAMDRLARDLAGAVQDTDLRQLIHRNVDNRFDGDTNVLWSDLSENSNFPARVAESGNLLKSSLELRQPISKIAAQVPGLQVAVPVHFDDWDPSEYEPWVTYFPEGVDDTAVRVLTAYDSNGNQYALDARVEPARPVIVLSQNERTDASGNLLPQVVESTAVASSALEDGPDETLVAGTRTRYKARMRAITLLDDKEPWAKGDAEIGMVAKSRNCAAAKKGASSGVDYSDHNWENLENDDDEDVWTGTRDLGWTKCDVVFSWWEDDGGAFDFYLEFRGFGLGIKMDDDDDLIGDKQLPYSSFKGTSFRKDEWSALIMGTD